MKMAGMIVSKGLDVGRHAGSTPGGGAIRFNDGRPCADAGRLIQRVTSRIRAVGTRTTEALSAALFWLNQWRKKRSNPPTA